MAEFLARWRQQSPWSFVGGAGHGGAPGRTGVRIELVDEAQILSIVGRTDRHAELALLLEDRIGCVPPSPGRMAIGRGCELIWSSPNQWLAVAVEAFRGDLVRQIADIAAVSDQSSSRALLEISGTASSDALAKGFAIDLHPEVFKQGCTAVTNVAHISVQIWQREAGRYTICVPRSFVVGFWSWLTAASAAYGYAVAAERVTVATLGTHQTV